MAALPPPVWLVVDASTRKRNCNITVKSVALPLQYAVCQTQCLDSNRTIVIIGMPSNRWLGGFWWMIIFFYALEVYFTFSSEDT